jgi:hypothetical protein
MKKGHRSAKGTFTNLPLIIGAIVLIGSVMLVFALLNRSSSNRDPTEARVEIPHIHGLGFSIDGSRLLVPSHIGLLIYEDNQWSQPDLPAHDYMGFSPFANGFFSSGHPDLRTDYEPLLGLVKSEDGGRTISTLAFEGESDFHTLAAGYRNRTIYVVNSTPNSQLGVGLFYTLDEGQTWTQSMTQGLDSAPIQIAAHPDESGTLAVASETGLWMSTDYGDTFNPLVISGPVTAATFSLEGEVLYFGYQSLNRFDLSSREAQVLSTPELDSGDAILYLARNPTLDQLAVATGAKDIFLSDTDETWSQIANDGIGG